MDLVGVIFLWFGVAFCIIGMIGVLRLPDVYSRLHSSGKVALLGVFGFLVASGVVMPETAARAVVLFLFLLFSSPVASHAIAAAAYQMGVPLYKPEGKKVRDDLAPQPTRTGEFPALREEEREPIS